MCARKPACLLAAIILILALLPASLAHAERSVAEPFRAYYDQYQGMRVLGYPITELIEANGYMAQYFEKGRIEDHHAERVPADWQFMYGRLTAELIERAGQTLVSGTSLTYADLRRYADPAQRRSAPERFAGGIAAMHDGIFIPYDAQLHPAPGYIVQPYFWAYMTRADLFPAGWLHDIGLPLTEAFKASAYKNGKLREITMQAFERAVLTYDPHNPVEWQVERGNIGADAVRLLPPANTIEIPAPGGWVTFPLHVLARVGRPGEQITAVLRWDNDQQMTRTCMVLRGEDGRGLLIGSFDIVPAQQPNQPWTQAARLEIRDGSGSVVAQQALRVLHPDDPDTREIELYWLVGERLQSELRRVPRASASGTGALNELLWGPLPQNSAGFTTALPTTAEVLSFAGRTAEWGPRVTLRKAALADGVAQVDFSRELRAYGDDSLRASLIHAQITRTLLQFPQVRDVRITIEGERDTLVEP